MTVAEKTLARMHERLAELRSELDVETDRGWIAHIEREIDDLVRRIEQVHTWAETPMGRKEVA
jgi:hypothetical protein